MSSTRPPTPSQTQTRAQARQLGIGGGNLDSLSGKPQSLTEPQCRMLARELLLTPDTSMSDLAARYNYSSVSQFRKVCKGEYMRAISAEVFNDFDNNRQVTFNLLLSGAPTAARLINESVEAGDVDTAKFVINKITPSPVATQHHEVDHTHSHSISAEVQHSLNHSLGEVLTLLKRSDGTFSADPEQYIRRGLDGLDAAQPTDLGNTQPASLASPTDVEVVSEGASPDAAQPTTPPLERDREDGADVPPRS